MAKITLALTMAALSALKLADLQVQYKEVTKKDPEPGLTKKFLLEEILELADPAEPEPTKSKKRSSEDAIEFDYGNKTYRVNAKAFPKVTIPGVGERTAAELGVCEKSQKYLVEQDCIGSIIDEVND